MADPNNPGQFGNRPDEEQKAASKKGGKVSSSKQNMSELGKKGARAQPTEAKRRGGENSHRGSES